ncbi:MULTISPECIES: microcin C ABC transporter permease YejB [Vitreoscilla]|uniref:ABC transporter permease subunit n=1 Tax=Vitreoscilla stercoraria TaxID=61 RepID=A0ABY4E7Z1_VITST|nr:MULTISPECIES: ABC transporter permease subunit [Vitreoscilla]AUZ04974.1 inner membrane ABC transporter permease protein YejB [Vitreoscilla sp. C1]UOO91384.1 ABC transporter permease subunit [Vitreoscilla stercoraria]
MFAYILKRLLLLIPTLLGILALTFAIIQFVPGGPVEQMVQQLTQGTQATAEVSGGGSLRGNQHGLSPEEMDKLKALYGFDQPPLTRFVDMVGNFLRFDLGESFFQPKTVTELVIEKLPVSMSLGLWTFFLTYLVCIPLGISKAVRDGSRFDAISSVFILIGYAIPGFVLGVLLLILFGGGSFWQWFPLGGMVSDDWDSFSTFQKIMDYLWHMVLPITASVVGNFAVMTLLTKNVFLEEIRRQYVYTARAKGLSERRIMFKHVFRNAMIPLITGFPAAFLGAFFTGSLLIETLFSLDGLGLLSYEAVMKRDYPVVMGTLYVFTLMGLLAKLLSDLSYVLVDPRIHFDGER